MGKLDGKVAAITGGTRSIGRGIADAFVREGASVVVNGRDETKGKACVEELAAGDRAACYAGDASKQEAVEGLVDFAIQPCMHGRRRPTTGAQGDFTIAQGRGFALTIRALASVLGTIV